MGNRIESTDSKHRDSHAWRDFGISGAGPVLLAIMALYFSKDATTLMQNAPQAEPVKESAAAQQESQYAETRQLAATMVSDTEGTWHELFAQADRQYENPELALFSNSVSSACNYSEMMTGPFYCEQDRKVYVDLTFLNAIQHHPAASSDFTLAYVIAHEIGHHVQNLLGVSAQVHRAQQRVKKTQAQQLATRLELQADCYAGVWMRRSAESRPVFADADIEKGLLAASAVGEARSQAALPGVVAPDSFTHGNAEQRLRWFKRGLDSGDFGTCDTFAVRKL